jgi:CAAX prenyl protease-like protein
VSISRYSVSRLREAPALARCLPFALFVLMLAVAEALPPAGEVAWDPRWLTVSRAAAIALVLVWLWPGYVELQRPERTSRGDWVLACVAGLAVFGLWIHLDDGWMAVGIPSGFDPRGPSGEIDWFLALTRLAGLALVVPVMEELFWRSFLMRWLQRRDFLSVDPRHTGWRSSLLTAVLFGSEHHLWLSGIFAGLVYNGLYVRKGNLWVPIAAHTVTNTALGAWVLATHNWHFW